MRNPKQAAAFCQFYRSHVDHPLENGAVLEELDRINPKIDKRGTRRARFHQHLTLGYGIEKLKRQVGEVMTLMKVSDTVGQFRRFFAKRFPQGGAQLDFLDDENLNFFTHAKRESRYRRAANLRALSNGVSLSSS